uniref:G-protein coupled receptors family 1 profile domain-containing protein n=1 Tax=Romanomermis culicivorax TaxID=13658 RepID=A0A915L6V5_ROMCU
MATTQQVSNSSSNFTPSKDEKPNANDDLIVVTVWSALLTYGFVTNLLTLAGIVRNQQMRRSTSYWLIMSLAVCDLLMITISLSHLIPATLWHDRFVAVSDFRNIFAIFLYDVFWYSGVIQLGGMAVNRYVSIVHSTHYRIHIRSGSGRICCLGYGSDDSRSRSGAEADIHSIWRIGTFGE